MPTINFGEWLPDQPGTTGAVTDAKNCYPVANGYAPFRSEADYSDAAAQDLLVTFAGKFGGATNLFAAGATQVYKFDSNDASLDALTTTGYTSTESWDVTQFGSKMIIANGKNKLQAYDMSGGTYFSDLAAAAPVCKYVTVVRDFVVAAENTEPDWLPVDGALLEGGGQIMRLALPLSTIFRIPVKLHSIRMG